VMFVHFVIVKLLQEAESFGAVGTLVDRVAEMNLKMLHVVSFLFVGRRAVFTGERFLVKRKD
jgi:hypothetical protein